MQWNVFRVAIKSMICLMVFSQPAVAQEQNWLGSTDEAVVIAARTGKMIVVSIGADWCHYCKKMDRETWSDALVQQVISQSFVPLKLTSERHRELLENLQIKSFPTTLVFTSDRRFVTRMDGYVDAVKMAKVLEQIRIAGDTSPFALRK